MAFCENCGEKLSPNAAFCENCGTKILIDEEPQIEEETVQKPVRRRQRRTAAAQVEVQTVGGSGEIKLCADGKYRWYYEFPMLKNPTLLFTIWKVMMISSCAPALVVMLGSLSDGLVDAFVAGFQVFLLVSAIFLVLSVIGYLIVAINYGGKYVVLFTMDDEGVVHMQQAKQFKKAEALGWITAMMGASSGNIGRAGQGMLVATKNSTSSTFMNVSSVIGLRRRNTIKVNQLFAKNQVYVDPRDYDFVWDYITERCTKAKIR